jgi:diguanylate cyclase (GGDEF)-like protein
VTFGEQVHADIEAKTAPDIDHPHAAPHSWAAVGEAPTAPPAAPLLRVEPAREPAPEPPTALLDRLNGEFAAARELARARREERSVSVVMFSVSSDGPAQPGLAAREDAAALVARTLIKVIRESDLPIRWAGDEVLLVLPGLGLDGARRVAERVRAALQAGTGHRAAVSAGVAELMAAEGFGALVTRAHERVRLALEHGHNRVA